MTQAAAQGDQALQDVLRGKPDGGQRSKVRSNMIRVFISSTFTDMSSERRLLLDKAYPEVLAFCRGLGLVFEVVDLRWGIRNVPYGDHEACELFMQEIERCKKVSAAPVFTALLGNRYGHRALPRVIPEKPFEVFLSKLSKNDEGVKLLSQWYLKDNNAVPPTYILQPITAHFAHYGDLRPENKQQRDSDTTRWRLTETQLLQFLRSSATDAVADGHITAQQKENYYTSVTEREFEQGLWKDDGQASALLFIREIPRQRVRDGPKRLAKFMDVTADGLLDADAQGLLTALKARLYATLQKILNLHCVELHKGGIDPTRKEHAQYLDSVCEQFVSQIEARISATVDSPLDVNPSCQRKVWGNIDDEQGKMSDWVVEEVNRHVAMSAERCEGFNGREGLLGKISLNMWESTNDRHGPLVVHGGTGMGKTALLCKLAQEMRSVLETQAAVVIRLLSAVYPRSFDVEHVLHSLCLQICLAFGLAPPTPLPGDTQLFRCFQNVLEQVSQKGNTLLIVLDGVDQLSDRQNAQKLRWLPLDIPPNIHLVVSMETNSEAFVSMRMRLETLDNFFEVERLSSDEGKQIMDTYLQASQRTLTPEQSNEVLKSFEQTGCPLHLKLMLSVAKHWSSFTPLLQIRVSDNAQEMMKQILYTLEEKHGRELVGKALGYIALAREGLLEAELRDILSLDDDVIKEVYRYSLPPTPALIRLPPLLWARLRRDLDHHLEERWSSGVVTIAFSSRRLYEAVSTRYLTSQRRGQSLKILSEYFMGRWSGKLKPVALPGLSLVLSDRKVPPQPLWFTPELANVRKLQELPFDLLHAGLWDELKQEVIGSAEWLFCKTRACGVSSVIQDLDQSSNYMECTETRLIRDALVLIKPSLDFLNGHMDVPLFYTELLARLSSLAKPYPALIGQLCRECEEWLLTYSEPILIPKCSFLQSPGGALQHTMTGIQGGVVCLDICVEAGLLVAGCDDGEVVVWSLDDKQLMHRLLGHTAAILTVKVVENAHCLSLAADGSLRRWSLLTGRQLLCIEEAVLADSAPSSVHLHLFEQKQLLFIHINAQVKVWSLAEAQPLLIVSSDEGSVVLGVLQDSFVSLHDSSLIRVFQPGSGKQFVETRLQDSERCVTVVTSASLPKRGKVFVVSEEGFLYQISQSGKHTSSKLPMVPSLFSVSKDEKILMAASKHILSLFNLDRDVLEKFLELYHDEDVLSAAVSSNCRLLASGSVDQLIRIWSMTTGALLDTLCGSNAPISSIIWFKDLVVSGSWATACVHVWSLKYDTRHKPVNHIPSGSAHVAFTKDCDRVFFVQDKSHKEVISWNQQTGCMLDRMAVSVPVCCLEVAQTKRLLLCGLSTGTIFIYPLAHPQETLAIPPPESLCRVLCLAVGFQEKQLAVAYEDSLCLFNMAARDGFPTVEGPMQRMALPLLQAPPSCMALLADQQLIYGTSCGEVKLHDFTVGKTSNLEAHHSRVTCVTVSNWGNHALVGSEDAVQRLWAMKPLGLEHTMEYKGFFFEGILCAAFSETDHFVFTGSQDRTIKVWGVSTGNLLVVQYVYTPVVKMLTYGNGFVALSRQGTIIKEVFRCPDDVGQDHNPLKNVKAHYRVTSKEKNQDLIPGTMIDLQNFNPAQLNLMDMFKSKPSPTCSIL